jgi:hypothetical protein
VAACPVTEIALIVSVCETAILRAEGTIVSIAYPACREQHMRVRDPRHLREAS